MNSTTARTISNAEIEMMNKEMERDFAMYGSPWPEWEPTDADFEAMESEHRAMLAAKASVA